MHIPERATGRVRLVGEMMVLIGRLLEALDAIDRPLQLRFTRLERLPHHFGLVGRAVLLQRPRALLSRAGCELGHRILVVSAHILNVPSHEEHMRSEDREPDQTEGPAEDRGPRDERKQVADTH